MAKKRLWIGSLGPYLFDDSNQVNDPDGVVTANQSGLTTDGTMNALGSPFDQNDLVRLKDLNDSLLTIGAIAIWHGDTTDIPSGWGLCDGSSYTDRNGNSITSPDLTAHFVDGLPYIIKL